MKKLIAVLCIAFPPALVFGQTANRGDSPAPWQSRPDQLERLSKQFPPDVLLPAKDESFAKTAKSMCVYPSGDQSSVTVKPCPATPRKFYLLAPPQDTTPKDKR
jgi:hypothetical protein